jgi:hypothetical protein
MASDLWLVASLTIALIVSAVTMIALFTVFDSWPNSENRMEFPTD